MADECEALLRERGPQPMPEGHAKAMAIVDAAVNKPTARSNVELVVLRRKRGNVTVQTLAKRKR